MELKNIPVKNIKGVGEKQEAFLAAAGILSVSDLLTFFPYRYLDFHFVDPNTVTEIDNITVLGEIISIPIEAKHRRNLSTLIFSISVKDLIIRVIIFNQRYLRFSIKKNINVMIYGKYDPYKKTIIANRVFTDNLVERIEPIYNIKDVSTRNVSRFVRGAMEVWSSDYPDYLPLEIRQKYQLIDARDLIIKAHFPKDFKDIKEAIRRLKYEELLKYSLKMVKLKMDKKIQQKDPINYDIKKVRELIHSLPYNLSFDQKEVLNEIFKDIKKDVPMNRIIQGDVGCGKTILALLSAYAYIISGFQVAIMAPTEILAKEHFETASELFLPYGIKVGFLVGSLSVKEKLNVLNDLESGEINIIIGTHALLSSNVNFAKLGLIVIDEQHRFGVAQREQLIDRYQKADTLYLTATPIPRSLALVLYEDVAISSINTKPAGRIPVETEIVSELTDENLIKKMNFEIKNKHQIFVVAPSILDNANYNHADIYSVAETLKKVLNNAKIRVMHAKMKQGEKTEIMQDFKDGDFDVLVSTTIVEVGINILNATMMVICDAMMFGLAQIHQLRGRVGRSNLKSYCYLVSDMELERLKVIKNSNDGFYLSNKDLELRGPGHLLGNVQSGAMDFKYASLVFDFNILKVAKDDAKLLYLDFLKNPKSKARNYVIEALNTLPGTGFILH